ncbi:hypothetical protein [Sorangium sp. So ce1024]
MGPGCAVVRGRCLPLELRLVNGELSGALWLFCDRSLCEACVGEA